MRLIDITGQTFGRLYVVRKSDVPCMWECVCSCGATGLYTGTNLRTGNSTSCGCAHKEQLASRNAERLTMEPWLADMNLYIRKLGYRRERLRLGSNQFMSTPQDGKHPTRALPWGLSLEEYKELVTSPCYYCGAPPSQQPQGVWMKGRDLKRNGIDRVDNSKGYELGNCVSCCTSCNREKRAQTQAQFFENTRRRYEHLKTVGLL